MTAVLYVDEDLPQFGVSSGGNRAFAIYEALERLSGDVCVLSYRRGLAYSNGEPEPLDGAYLSRWLQSRERQSTIVWGARPASWNLVRHVLRAVPAAAFVFDTVDHHRLRAERGLKLGIGIAQGEAAGLLWERAALLRAHVAVAVTVDEVSSLARHSKCVRLVPNSIPMFEPLPEPASCGVGFIGNWDHRPNVDGVEWFLKRVWPLVLKGFPNARFFTAGSGHRPSFLDSEATTDLGAVRDVRALYERVTVAVAPLRYGAGLKGKVAEAYAYGRPVAGTSIAFEGYDECERWSVSADSDTLLAAGICALLTSKDTRERLVREGRLALREQFNETLDQSVGDAVRTAVGVVASG